MMRTSSMFGRLAGLSIAGALAISAGAQQPADQGGGQTQPGVIYPAPSKPLGGVPAAAPRATYPQGVPAALPQVTPPVGVPSRNPPIRQTPIVPTPVPTGPVIVNPQPIPPTTTVDNTRSNLVRRLLDARYGPGYSIVDGRIVQDHPKPMMNGWQPATPTDTYWAHPAINPIDGTIRGVYTNSRDLWLSFVVGQNFPTFNYRTDLSYGKYPQRLYRSFYSGYEDWNRLGPCGYENPYLIVGGDRTYIVDPRLTTPTDTGGQVRELTPLEKAEVALRAGDAGEAVKQLKLHLKDAPDDAPVERLLAMALLDDRKVDQGVAVLMHAYMKQPQLAADALDPSMLSGGEMRHRQRFSQVMDYANRVKTGSGYLAASVLAQSEGRFDTAKKMLDKAIAAGLDKKVADEMAVGIANR